MADDTQQLDTTAPDPSPFIRTMAKDVARLTGKGAPPPVTTSKKDAPQPGVLLPHVDESQVAYKDAAPKEFKTEVLETSKEDEKAVIAEKQKGASFFASIPHAPVPVAPSVEQPTEEERKKILDRLRAKASQQPEAPKPAPAPQPEPPVEAPAPGIPAVSKDPYRQPLPPAEEPVYRPVAPTKAAPVPPPTAPPVAPPAPSALHTYKSDFADRMTTQQATSFSVLAAAGDAGQSTTKPTTPKRSLLPVIGGIVLVVAGIASAGSAVWYLATRPRAAIVPTVPSLVIPDETLELRGTGFEMYATLVGLADEASVDGNVYVAYVSTSTPTQRGIEVTPLPGGYLIAQLPLHAPTILLRNLDTKSTVGVIDTGPETRVFFILRVTSYERSFAGMLAWENSIATDLKALYPAFAEPVSTASTTPTKKPVAPPPSPAPPRFVDEIVANHDVRALKDAQNRTILLYGYRDKATLIIARDEDAFSALITRLTATTQ